MSGSVARGLGNLADTLGTTATANVSIDSGVLFVDSVNNRVGINTTTPEARLTILSSTNFADVLTRTTSVTQGLWADQSAAVGVVGTVTSHPLTLYTNNTERMRIDTNGRVAIASQPSFRVTRSNNNSVSAGVVLFDNIVHNIGSHYSSGTGRFTAPVTGSYLLTATGGQGSAYGFDIRVNGGIACRIEIVGVTFGYTWQTGAVIVRMNANDFADVNVFTGTPQFEPGLGSFTGHFLG